MNNKEFWEKAYLAAISSGNQPSIAVKVANESVEKYLEIFPEELDNLIPITISYIDFSLKEVIMLFCNYSGYNYDDYLNRKFVRHGEEIALSELIGYDESHPFVFEIKCLLLSSLGDI